MSNCSVIVVNYNTGELLKKTIEAALENGSVHEILVVDNNSSDGSMGLVQESKKLKKHYRTRNHGFASSCNFGANLATSENLLFLNPDCIVNKTTIDILSDEINNLSGSAIIGCRVNNPDGTEQRASRRRLPTFWRSFKTFSKIERLAKYCHCFSGVNLNFQPMPENVIKVEAISGAFIMIKTKAFKKINGFDEQFPLHFEDLDLFKRTLNAGFTIMFNPNATVTHYQGTSSQSNPKVAQLKQIGRQRYFKKHLSYFSYLLVKFLK